MNMNRTSTLTSFFTYVGMMITLVGIFLCLFFLFTPVTFGATSFDAVVNRSPDLQLSMRWIQPIVGQAIVEDALIKQQYKSENDKALKASNRTQRHGSTHDDGVSVDHALIQWVMGRLIVELTSHRMESGLPAPIQLRDETNQWILTIAQLAGRQLDEILRAERQNKRADELPFIF
jgi:hypothetical protein